MPFSEWERPQDEREHGPQARGRPYSTTDLAAAKCLCHGLRGAWEAHFPDPSANAWRQYRGPCPATDMGLDGWMDGWMVYGSRGGGGSLGHRR